MDPRNPNDIDNDRKREAILNRFSDGMLNKYDLVDWLLVEVSEDTLDEVYEEYCVDEDYDPEGDSYEGEVLEGTTPRHLMLGG
jgi:hypothetical protein